MKFLKSLKTLKGKTLREILILLLPALLVTLLAVSPASAAISIRQAREKANFQQNWDCYHWFAGQDFDLWKCQHPSWEFPRCWVSSLPSGRGAYLCQGKFMQRSRIQTGMSRVCQDRIRYTSRGDRIVHSIGPCQQVSSTTGAPDPGSP